MDVTNPEAMVQLDRWGGCDLWVHAAVHAAPLSPALHVDPKDMDKSVAVNITATHGLAVLFEPLLRARFFPGEDRTP